MAFTRQQNYVRTQYDNFHCKSHPYLGRETKSFSRWLLASCDLRHGAFNGDNRRSNTSHPFGAFNGGLGTNHQLVAASNNG